MGFLDPHPHLTSRLVLWLCLLSVLCCPPCLCPRPQGTRRFLGPPLALCLPFFPPRWSGGCPSLCSDDTHISIYSWTSLGVLVVQRPFLLDGPTVYLIGVTNLTCAKLNYCFFCPWKYFSPRVPHLSIRSIIDPVAKAKTQNLSSIPLFPSFANSINSVFLVLIQYVLRIWILFNTSAALILLTLISPWTVSATSFPCPCFHPCFPSPSSSEKRKSLKVSIRAYHSPAWNTLKIMPRFLI